MFGYFKCHVQYSIFIKIHLKAVNVLRRTIFSVRNKYLIADVIFIIVETSIYPYNINGNGCIQY